MIGQAENHIIKIGGHLLAGVQGKLIEGVGFQNFLFKNPLPAGDHQLGLGLLLAFAVGNIRSADRAGTIIFGTLALAVTFRLLAFAVGDIRNADGAFTIIFDALALAVADRLHIAAFIGSRSADGAFTIMKFLGALALADADGLHVFAGIGSISTDGAFRVFLGFCAGF